jgi:DnaJ-class molecular chaperone
MPKLGRGEERGDLFIVVEALLPAELSPRERELVEELRGIRS